MSVANAAIAKEAVKKAKNKTEKPICQEDRLRNLDNRPPEMQLKLGLACAADGKTVVCDRYMAYPLSVSPVFRLEANGSGLEPELERRAYLYRMNTSPGLLAGDKLGMAVNLAAGCELYLTDQAATKVHTMPVLGSQAVVMYDITVEEAATLEFLPEPLILFADAQLKQTTTVVLHESAGLTLGEIVLPGRLARGEMYMFREYLSRIRVATPEGRVWFIDAMKLLGQENCFAESALFATYPVLGTLLLVLPAAVATTENLNRLNGRIDSLSVDGLELACSTLPGDRGLFVRAISATTRDMQAAFKTAAGFVRSIRNQPSLPYSL
ncbi:MAG: urease accessory protein UreD [Cyanobacteria bacterium J06632_3]